MFKKKMALVLALVMVLSFSTIVAFAEDLETVVVSEGSALSTHDTTTVVEGGALKMSPFGIASEGEGNGASKFSKVTLDGTTKTATAKVNDMTLTDATGTGAGWNVSLQASQFINTGAENNSLNTLPLNSLKLASVAIAVDTENASESTPVAGGEGRGAITSSIANTPIDYEAPVTILSAAINGGMGKYTITSGDMTLTLLPKDAKAGTYSSTITMTFSQGPVTVE